MGRAVHPAGVKIPFAAGQRLDYPFIRPGLTLLQLFVLNFQRPVLASALLTYRHERLAAARAAAGAAGYRGAMFPWQSGSDGREETQRLHLNGHSGRWLPDHSYLQRHVNIAVAYNGWQHYMVTGSIQLLRFGGAEMLIEIARFRASLATCGWTVTRSSA
jgi:trehalose/maltose hydrolase-like predicted phosphorylase